VRPEGGHLPVYFGGASDDAVRVGGKHADVYAFWGEPLAGIRQRIAQVQAAAPGRRPRIDRFSVSLRPIAAATEEAAWERAHEILEAPRSGPPASRAVRDTVPGSGGIAAAAPVRRAGDLHDKRLWTALSKATGAAATRPPWSAATSRSPSRCSTTSPCGRHHAAHPRLRPAGDAAAYANLIRLVHDQVGDDIDSYRARVAGLVPRWPVIVRMSAPSSGA
jgi:alkanesulfonate monooxygenase